ncbi:MAG: hypothetical protein JSS83_12185 [Cyanobacteria bacterium SZAS LIN-3]|nr:hypothetical protein [Cyanobacteria bacterium SZAS LIN-3]
MRDNNGQEQRLEYFPLPHGTVSPYGHLACDDNLFLEACAHDNKVWQEHQERMRAMVNGIRNHGRSTQL